MPCAPPCSRPLLLRRTAGALGERNLIAHRPLLACAAVGLALSLICPAGAAELSGGDAGPTETTLEALHAANVARAAVSSERAAWASERERLQAVADDEAAASTRLSEELAAVTAARDQARAQLTAIPGAAELSGLRHALATAAQQLTSGLQALSGTVAPGVVSVPSSGDAAIDEVIRCLDATERGAASAAVDLVSGQRGNAGETMAVKLLHVSGAAAWWLALDGGSAGSAHMTNGVLVLDPAGDEPVRAAISEAIAILEGRRPARFVLLPLSSPLALGSATAPAAAAAAAPAPASATASASSGAIR